MAAVLSLEGDLYRERELPTFHLSPKILTSTLAGIDLSF
jgi:hypothetical protein